jgi:hypothetical protein
MDPLVTGTGWSLLSPIRLERLASAFELSNTEVLTDAETIVDWAGGTSDLESVLNARHGWRTDEAFYFIRRVRLEAWCTQNRIPDQRSLRFAEG